MIVTKCPSCGAEGRIPNTKVNTRLVCPKCLKIFHVTSAGRSTTGEPPAPSGAAAAKGPASHPADQAQKFEDAFRELSDTLFTRKGMYVALGLLVLGLIVYFISFRRGEMVEDSAAKVARAVVEGDLQTLRGMCSTGTVNAALAWYDTIRPHLDSVGQNLRSGKLIIAVHVTLRDPSQGTADVIATVFLSEGSLERKPGSLPDTSVALPSSRSIMIAMSFRKEGWAGWHLDGARTGAMPPLGGGRSGPAAGG